jgi:hypothetical protein
MNKQPRNQRARLRTAFAAAQAAAETLYQRLADAVHTGQVAPESARLCRLIETLPVQKGTKAHVSDSNSIGSLNCHERPWSPFSTTTAVSWSATG